MDNLENLTYKELRKIAKSLGMKAKGKAGKLIKEIRNYNEEHRTSIERKHTMSSSSTVSSSTDDDEIIFSLDPVPGAIDEEEVHEPNVDDDDDEIVFVTTPIENNDAKNDECNKSAELESIEDQLSESNQHDKTVEFEEHQDLKSELVDEEMKEQLNTTFEIETDKNEDSTVDKEGESHVQKENIADADHVQDLLEVMRPEMTDEEMKAALMAAIDKKVKNKKVTIMSPNAPSEFVSRIPTFSNTVQKSQANKEKATLKGKDWQKIHEKLFSKQDSLDVYLAKKTKRMQKMNTPMKSVKPIKEESQVTGEKLKKQKDTKSATKSLVKKQNNHSFIPKIVSTKAMNLQFATTNSTVSSVTKSNCSPSQNQKNKMIKSVKKSPRKSLSDSAKKLKHSPVKMSLAKSPLTKKPFTPYNFGNTSVSQSPNSVKKFKFDLQASLAKPITWKRHTGKLKPIAFGDVEPQYFKKGLNASIQKNRENRRAVTAQSRANKRDNLLNSRRNIN